mgnify:CR=1 FL=1
MTYHMSIAALVDPTRRQVFERLRPGARSVGEIARGLPVSRPAVSQHLRVLRDAGLVSERRQGTRRLYAIDLAGLAVGRVDQLGEPGAHLRVVELDGDRDSRERSRAAKSAALNISCIPLSFKLLSAAAVVPFGLVTFSRNVVGVFPESRNIVAAP